jgi:hypothetical protein
MYNFFPKSFLTIHLLFILFTYVGM